MSGEAMGEERAKMLRAGVERIGEHVNEGRYTTMCDLHDAVRRVHHGPFIIRRTACLTQVWIKENTTDEGGWHTTADRLLVSAPSDIAAYAALAMLQSTERKDHE